jgi:hypothetical protein
MIDRRHLSLLLLGGAAGLSACAGGEDASVPEADLPDLLFISPMGEPFRVKPPQPYPVDLWFKGADRNGDGKLDLAEFQADAERFFHVLDRNHDGVIDHTEIYYYENRICPEIVGLSYGARGRRRGEARLWLAADTEVTGWRQAQIDPNGLGGANGPPVVDGPPAVATTPYDKPLVGAAMYNILQDPEPVQGADIHLTGRISLIDFRTRAEQRFKLLDENERGYLTLATLPQTKAQQMMPKDSPKRGRAPVRKA